MENLECPFRFCFFFFFLIFILFFFNIVVVFVIHWRESAMDLHVFPIPIPPPTSLVPVSLVQCRKEQTAGRGEESCECGWVVRWSGGRQELKEAVNMKQMTSRTTRFLGRYGREGFGEHLVHSSHQRMWVQKASGTCLASVTEGSRKW